VNLLDEEAVSDALSANPACVNCHQSLDPIASYLFGFWWFDYTSPGEASFYFPEREQRWKDYNGVPPAWYGQPGAGLAGLGHQIAADGRFVDCAVEHAWELLLRRDRDIADTDALIPHRNAFISGGLTVKALFRSVLCRVNRGRVAKARLFAFLRREAEAGGEAEQIVAEILGPQSLTMATGDKAAGIGILLEIRRRSPQVDNPLTIAAPPLRPPRGAAAAGSV
jgi:hypothetical protein